MVPGLDSRGPSLPLAEDKAQLGEARPSMLTGLSLLGGLDFGISSFWVKDGLRGPSEEELQFDERSKTDCALMEEALRYGNDPILIGSLVSGSSSSPSSFSGQTPLGEYYDLSGAGLDITQGVSLGRLFNVTGSTEQETVTHWELMEVNIGSIKESREELCLVRTMPQEVRE